MAPASPGTSLIQKLFGYVGFILATSWLVMLLAGPIVEYRYGKGPLTTLVSSLSSDFLLGLLGFVGLTFVLGWAGVLQRQPRPPQPPSAYGISGRGLLLGLAFAFVGALALITIATLYPPFASDKRLTELVLNIGPMLLLIGVWIAVMTGIWLDQRMRRGVSKDGG